MPSESKAVSDAQRLNVSFHKLNVHTCICSRMIIAAMIMIGFATADAIIAFLMFYVPITSPTSASTPDGLNDYLAMSNTLQIFHASIFCAIVILQDCMLVRNIYRGQ